MTSIDRARCPNCARKTTVEYLINEIDDGSWARIQCVRCDVVYNEYGYDDVVSFVVEHTVDEYVAPPRKR